MPETIETEVERCTCESIGLTLTGDDAVPCVEAMNAYLAAFAAPEKSPDFPKSGHVCLQCGEPTDGLLGRFIWGMRNGEGTCGECGWPARAHHYPELPDGERIFERVLELVLQYHPDQVTISPTEDPDA